MNKLVLENWYWHDKLITDVFYFLVSKGQDLWVVLL